jgi:hypothetical protein
LPELSVTYDQSLPVWPGLGKLEAAKLPICGPSVHCGDNSRYTGSPASPQCPALTNAAVVPLVTLKPIEQAYR